MFAVSNIAAVQQGKATVLGKMCGGGIYSTFSSDGTSSAIRISSDHVTENRYPLCAVAALCMCKAYGAKQQKPPAPPVLRGCAVLPGTHRSTRCRYSLQLFALPSLPVICTVTAASVSGGLS